MKRNNILLTIELRQKLRRQMTPAERSLWRIIKQKQVLGYKFRRQHSIDCFILDFYCATLKLAIEVDGSYHQLPSQREKDERRTVFLNRYGIDVLRLENELITEWTRLAPACSRQVTLPLARVQ